MHILSVAAAFACRTSRGNGAHGRAAHAQRLVPLSGLVLLVCFMAPSAAVPRPVFPLSGVPASSGCMSVLGVWLLVSAFLVLPCGSRRPPDRDLSAGFIMDSCER